MEEVLQKIAQMADSELQDVMRVIQARYTSAYPEWDVLYLALPKDPQKRREQFGQVLALLGNYVQDANEILLES